MDSCGSIVNEDVEDKFQDDQMIPERDLQTEELPVDVYNHQKMKQDEELESEEKQRYAGSQKEVDPINVDYFNEWMNEMQSQT